MAARVLTSGVAARVSASGVAARVSTSMVAARVSTSEEVILFNRVLGGGCGRVRKWLPPEEVISDE